MKDYYGILGVTPKDSQKKIYQVYRNLCAIYFADVLGSRVDEKEFEEIDEAYNVLIDPHRRKIYDRERRMFYKVYPTAKEAILDTQNLAKNQPNDQTIFSRSSYANSRLIHKTQTQSVSSQNQNNSQTIRSGFQSKVLGLLKKALKLGLITSWIILLSEGTLRLGHVVFGVDDPKITGSVSLVISFFVAIACIAVGGLFAWLIAGLS